MSKNILIVDDNVTVNTSLEILLRQAGYKPLSVTSPGKALKILENDEIDLVLQDMNFTRKTTGEEGIALLKNIKKLKPRLPVILITAWGSISLAVQGIREGAADFITKPWSNEQILQSLKTCLGLAEANSAAVAGAKVSREELDARYDFEGLIGEEQNFLKILEVAGRVSSTDASVLITGESGTGKELIAEAIHRNSNRYGKPFVKVNLGGISSTLFESEMFGNVKGAYTDAKADRKGRFEVANGGTIFLDEIGDLELENQVKLLRVLQDRTYEVLGSSVTRTVDVRVIAATNKNLVELVEKKEFREDLLYRLNLISLHLSSLRERRTDIPLLVDYFLQNVGKVYRRLNLSIDDGTMDWLKGLSLPGNVRQLRQLLERTVLLTNNDVLTIRDFKYALEMQPEFSGKDDIPQVGSMTINEIEKAMILKAVKHFKGNITKIAEALGLSRAALYRRFEKYGIKP
ncbi:MAG: sigma-54 dependent transcriptional regulator [Patescibacteria group bacterium]|nr:sigma-54 dependent transcriptional regulator [Patescibacteria group bacterium]